MSKPWNPLPFQVRGVEHLVQRASAGVFLKPGMRKTSIVLAAFKVLKKLGFVKSMLVLAPLRVCYTSWPSEIKKWDDFKDLSIGILHGRNKEQVLREKHDVYVCNYDGIKWLSDRLRIMGAKNWPFDMLVADESTKFKHTNTLRFKSIKPLLKYFKRRVILTGTPSANGLMNLFGQCYVMDIGETFGPYVTQFRETFFFQTGYGGYTWLPKPGAEKSIYAHLGPKVYYAHDEDWLKLPPLIEKEVFVELPSKARNVYKQMETILRLEFEEGKVIASNTAVASMKCRQIANGGVYIDSSIDKKWSMIHDAKSEAVLDLIEELNGQPALVTYEFLHDLERLKSVLGKDTPHIGKGGVPPNKMPELVAAWNRKELPAILVNPQSMAHGVDGLQEAGRALIWHSLTYDYELVEQLIKRLRRSGQEERVLVAYVIAANTIDEAVYASGKRKEKGQNALFSALKEYWR